jgi:hypothetical protein
MARTKQPQTARLGRANGPGSTASPESTRSLPAPSPRPRRAGRPLLTVAALLFLVWLIALAVLASRV